MGNKEFAEMAVESVVNYYNNSGWPNETYSEIDNLKKEEVYIVWICKILQNNKALLSTERRDGMYYEVTYDGNKGAYYFDAYKKMDNIAVPLFFATFDSKSLSEDIPIGSNGGECLTYEDN